MAKLDARDSLMLRALRDVDFRVAGKLTAWALVRNGSVQPVHAMIPRRTSLAVKVFRVADGNMFPHEWLEGCTWRCIAAPTPAP